MSVPEVTPDEKRKQALLRFVKIAVAAAVAAAIGWLAGPNVADVVGTQNAVLVAAVLTPLLSALEKFLNGPTVKVPVKE